MARARRGLLVLALLPLLGCGQDEVLSDHDAHRVLDWDVACRTAGSGLNCTLFDRTTNTDQTSNGGWSATGPAVMDSPGHVQATGQGEVTVTVVYVAYDIAPGQRTRTAAQYFFDPPRTARKLYWLGGLVRESSGDQFVPGVLVTILDGYNSARSATTSASGSYRIEPILTGEDFTVRAEKQGYQPLTVSYRVDDSSAIGAPGNGPFLDLRLLRVP